jgi:TRAP transporter TAXI family solute receptor
MNHMTEKQSSLGRRGFLNGLAGLGAIAGLGIGPAMARNVMRMSTMSPGTSPNLVMTAFANIVNRELPNYEIQLNSTGAATRHVIEVAKNNMAFCMTSPVITALMRSQSAMYAKIDQAPEWATHLRTVLNFPMGIYHIAVFANSGIETLADARGKRVFLGPPGSAAYTTMSQLFRSVAGLTPGEDFDAVNLGWEAAAASFQDANLDVYCNPTNAPSPALTQIAVINPIRFLGIPDDAIDSDAVQALTRRPGFSVAPLKAGTYGPNQVNESDVATLAVTVSIVTNEWQDPDMIRDMVLAFYAGLPAMQSSAPWISNVNPEAAIQDINLTMHPGAQAALEQLGVIIPEIARG